MYAYLDDGPYAREALRLCPGRDGRPPRAIELADPGGGCAAVRAARPAPQRRVVDLPPRPFRRRVELTFGAVGAVDTVADFPTVYAYLDDGPHAKESLRIQAEPDGRPPSSIDLADADGTSRSYELRGPHHNDEWWIYRLVRDGSGEPDPV